MTLCPFCEKEIEFNDFLKIEHKKNLTFGKHTTTKFKGQEIYSLDNSDSFSNMRTVFRMWECPHCHKLLQITQTNL